MIPSAFDEIKAAEELKFKAMEERFNNMESMLEKLIAGLSKTTDQQQFHTMTKSLLSSGLLKLQECNKTKQTISFVTDETSTQHFYLLHWTGFHILFFQQPSPIFWIQFI